MESGRQLRIRERHYPPRVRGAFVRCSRESHVCALRTRSSRGSCTTPLAAHTHRTTSLRSGPTAKGARIGASRIDRTVPVAFSSYGGMDISRDNGLVVDRAYEDTAPCAYTGTVKRVIFV